MWTGPAAELVCDCRLVSWWLKLRQEQIRPSKLVTCVLSQGQMSMDLPTPNNLGATLLIVVGACMTPLLIGIPIVLYALAQLRAKDGTRTYSFLTPKCFNPRLEVSREAR